MIKTVEIRKKMKMEDYARFAVLAPVVNQFIPQAQSNFNKVNKRKIWQVSSTAQGGGVAEMLQNLVWMIDQFNVENEWVVINSDEKAFFNFTKNLHNLIHGKGDPNLDQEEIELFHKVNQENAESFLPRVKDGDIVVIHDPQPIIIAKFLREQRDIKLIWRCHIGLDEANTQTKAAWDFLTPFLEYYDHHVFSAPQYVPPSLNGNTSIIYPGIDPLSHKNRMLSIHKLTGILYDSDLVQDDLPSIAPRFEERAKRLNKNGQFESPLSNGDIGLLYRPVVTQVSRWDRLKGFAPLMEGFAKLKRNTQANKPEKHQKRIKYCRLVLAGPDPAYIADDPEGIEVLNELISIYQALPSEIADDVVLVSLPMKSIKENALIVNAIQNCSTIVAQNSIQEGFGLTATEAMWKSVPLMSSSACGLRQQIRDNVDGKVVSNATDTDEIAEVLDHMLFNAKDRESWSSNAQKRVLDNFLIFNQLGKWAQLYEDILN